LDPWLDLLESWSPEAGVGWGTGVLEKVMGMPLGAETGGSLIALSGRGTAEAKLERNATAPMKEVTNIMVEYRTVRERAFVKE